MLKKIVFYIVTCLYFNIKTVVCHILRLECYFYGEFTEQQDNKYSGSSVDFTLHNITASDCIARCLFRPNCKSINHRKDEGVCELLTTTKDSIIVQNGWKYYTTDYNKLKNGPYCQSEESCTIQQQCFDTCDDNKYKCEPFPLEEIAQSKPISMVSEFLHISLPAQLCNDGNRDTYCHTGSGTSKWLKIDFQAEYRIYAVKLIARPEFLHRVKNLSIYIGNITNPANGRQNALFKVTDTEHYENLHTNNSLKFHGRYLYVFDNRNVVVNFLEIEVFGRIAT